MEKMSAVRRRTDRVIRENFLWLLEEKPLNKITVQDLCEEAEINRLVYQLYGLSEDEIKIVEGR